PLNGDNYAAWHHCLEWILDDQELWDITSGAIAGWKKNDKKARKKICLRISDEHLVYIAQSMTRITIWTRLQGIFVSKGAVGIIN
ncbi:hypothetical protein JB92DRAFT_2634130, partial [Gautieria morchelliformis]